MFPEAGGEYNYLKAAYGDFWGFLYGWTQTWVAKSGSIATLATGFFYYLANFNPGLESSLFHIPIPLGPDWGPVPVSIGQLCAIAVILGLGLLNWYGVRVGGNVQLAVTILKIVLIAGIVVLGLSAKQGNVANFNTSTPSRGGIPGFFAALVAALWAYDGWNNVSMVSSEVKDPQRNLPRSLVYGTGLVVLIYLLTNVAYFHVLDAAQVAASDRVAAQMMHVVFGPVGAAAVSFAAMISIFAALNGSILSGSRVPYALARDRYFFSPFARIHARHATPGFSILALSLWASLLVLSGRYDQLLTLVIFPSWILYGMSAFAVIVLRHKLPLVERAYKTVGYPVVPLLFVAVAALLIYFTLQNSPRESTMGLVLIGAGIPFYIFWNRRKKADLQSE
jgi:amino acid transporter